MKYFISYAQNYEDVMLHRALKHVQRGFYIDVGAQDPVEDSVTKAFYERGWHGINIEPVEHWYRRLLEDRPHDINLRLAASDRRGMLHLFEVADTGLSTTDASVANRHKGEGQQLREYEVECRTLDSICAEHGVVEVHFLKIDVEGAEESVLRGLSLDRIRPWIIVIEAALPNSQDQAWEAWQPLLIGHDYDFVYADGLNRFYVAHEREPLSAAFRFPPNIFDTFVRHAEMKARTASQEAAARLAQADAQLDLVETTARLARAESASKYLQLENERREAALVELRQAIAGREAAQAGEIVRLQGEIALRERTITHLLTSTSWRISAPVRWGSRGARIATRGVRLLAYQVLRWPARAMRPLLRTLANRWPAAQRYLRGDSTLALHAHLFLFGAPAHILQQESMSPERLTHSAKQVLETIERRKK